MNYSFVKQLIAVNIIAFISFSCQNVQKKFSVSSPDSKITIEFQLTESGVPQYTVSYNNSEVVKPSSMSFDFKELPSLIDGFEIVSTASSSFNEDWEMPWGEQETVKNQYNELKVFLQETEGEQRKLNVVFRVFNDGVGFRYEFPEQKNLSEILITDENTEFNLTGDHNTWWIPGDWDIYEHIYSNTKLSEIDALSKRDHPNLAATYIPENAVNTPVTMKTDNGIYLSIHEAALTNYSGMTLKVDTEKLSFVSELVGSENLGGKAQVKLPFNTPWRTIQIADRAGDLIESKMILNLNEPNVLGDVSYFTPMKYVGIWWEMHLGLATWDYESAKENPKVKHGATTENAKRYIDFASENGIKGLLVEGWNTGWNQWLSGNREGIFDFMTPYADYNFDEVMAYAKEKGVEVIMHHETSAAPRTYEKQMDEAYNFMKENGMNSVKTGYVGKIIPDGEYHHGQWMVKHYHKVLVEAASKEIAINAHEPIKATGKRRTYPNAIAREGLRGQEFNAWSIEKGNPPSHLPTVAFTRMLSGPIDFTPGAFNLTYDGIPNRNGNRINTTLAHQIALYVVIYSPIQMLCDLPEHYMEGDKLHPMFQFIKDVGVDWQQTKVLDGEVGDFVVIARQEKESNNWFVGGITGDDENTVSINFDFLDANKNYTATVYKDGTDAHWDNKPTDYLIESIDVSNTSSLDVKMAAGGGFAISIMEK